MVMKSQILRDGAIAVLRQCGPFRRAGVIDPVGEAAKKWMLELLKMPDGAIGITEAIIGVWEAHHGAQCLLCETQPEPLQV
jgi:hypothetical protein